ncbi:hypothetical protein BS47DRAFT_1401448 [Hydnum rufescens UP504]|uniref:Uncharacterized protein n=1 Tax=Hydnum rufescens UP504 TaxID=1448309 RepID=A0A9P6DMM3_9AGAM|nr:hypothetical protein BS47DRAFT_1401448 [Hydnum rufescens UP504]
MEKPPEAPGNGQFSCFAMGRRLCSQEPEDRVKSNPERPPGAYRMDLKSSHAHDSARLNALPLDLMRIPRIPQRGRAVELVPADGEPKRTWTEFSGDTQGNARLHLRRAPQPHCVPGSCRPDALRYVITLSNLMVVWGLSEDTDRTRVIMLNPCGNGIARCGHSCGDDLLSAHPSLLGSLQGLVLPQMRACAVVRKLASEACLPAYEPKWVYPLHRSLFRSVLAFFATTMCRNSEPVGPVSFRSILEPLHTSLSNACLTPYDLNESARFQLVDRHAILPAVLVFLISDPYPLQTPHVSPDNPELPICTSHSALAIREAAFAIGSRMRTALAVNPRGLLRMHVGIARIAGTAGAATDASYIVGRFFEESSLSGPPLPRPPVTSRSARLACPQASFLSASTALQMFLLKD